MALTHSIFKNKPIPTEVSIHPPAVKLSEMKNPDVNKKVIDAFNHLHINMLAINALIRNTLQFDKDSLHIPLALIKIMIDYCSLVEEYEPYRLKGVRDISPEELLVLTKDHSYPLILTYQADGVPQARITANLKEYRIVKLSHLQNLCVEYKEFYTPQYRSIYSIEKGIITRSKYNGTLYCEGISVINSVSPFMHDDFNRMAPGNNHTAYYYDSTYLQILKIPSGKLADIAIGADWFQPSNPSRGILSYTLAPSEFCQFRAFDCGKNVFLVNKVYDPKPSTSLIASFFYCKSRRSAGALTNIKKAEDSNKSEKRIKLS